MFLFLRYHIELLYNEHMTNNNDSPTSNRSRIFTWEDPLAMFDQVLTLPGIEHLRAMHAGTMPRPPIMELLNYEVLEIEVGRVTFVMTPAEYHYNPAGVVHGGVTSTIADSAMAFAIQTMLPAGASCTTLELHVNFVRPLTANSGRVRAIGEVLHKGRTIATAQARVVDNNDKLYSHATCTCMIIYADAEQTQTNAK